MGDAMIDYDQRGPILHPDVSVALSADMTPIEILERVCKALRDAGYGDEIEAFTAEAMSSDEKHLRATVAWWVDVI